MLNLFMKRSHISDPNIQRSINVWTVNVKWKNYRGNDAKNEMMSKPLVTGKSWI